MGYRVVPRKGEWVRFVFGATLQTSWAVEPDFFVGLRALGQMVGDPTEGEKNVDFQVHWRYFKFFPRVMPSMLQS